MYFKHPFRAPCFDSLLRMVSSIAKTLPDTTSSWVWDRRSAQAALKVASSIKKPARMLSKRLVGSASFNRVKSACTCSFRPPTAANDDFTWSYSQIPNVHQNSEAVKVLERVTLFCFPRWPLMLSKRYSSGRRNSFNDVNSGCFCLVRNPFIVAWAYNGEAMSSRSVESRAK